MFEASHHTGRCTLVEFYTKNLSVDKCNCYYVYVSHQSTVARIKIEYTSHTFLSDVINNVTHIETLQMLHSVRSE